MTTQLRSVDQGTPRPRTGPRFAAGILRLVKSAPEREAIAAGQVDAVIDPASGEVILLPGAQQALHQGRARISSLLALAADWLWEQDENYRLVSLTGTAAGGSALRAESVLGKPLWELGFRTAPGFDWDAHRQQLEWRATFRDLELEWTDGANEARWVSIDGEAIFDARDQFKGYRGTMRDVTQRKWSQALAQGWLEAVSEPKHETEHEIRPLRPRPGVAMGVPMANDLLAALPGKDWRSLLPGLEQVTLSSGEVLYEPGEPIHHVYFPTGCLVSLQTAVTGRLALEVGLVGRDGMVGVSLVLGSSVSSVRALVLGTGGALRMSAARFRRAFRKSLPLQAVAYLFVDAKLALARQTAACAHFHGLEGRLAGWLLGACDRIGSGELHFTHENLAAGLGVRRVGITLAASNLERQKLITYRRGNISILDRDGLEAASCGCYRISKDMAHGVPVSAPKR